MDLCKYRIPATEEYIFNEAPIYSHVDEWQNKVKQVLWITGLSGGGKGYVAKQMAKDQDDVTIVELDKFENYPWYIDKKDSDPHVAKGDKIIFDYLKSKIGGYLYNLWIDNTTEYQRDMKYFVEYLLSYMNNHPNERFIVEGIQIFSDDAFSFLSNQDALIVIRTAKVHNMAQVMHRSHNQIRNRMHSKMRGPDDLKAFCERLNLNTAEVLV